MEWRRRAGLGLALAAAVLAGCGTYGGGGGEQSAARGPGEAPAGGFAPAMLPGSVAQGGKDALFVAEAAHGSASELAQSRIALERAQSPEVKEFAQTMVNDHRAAGRQLMELAQREGHALPSMPANMVSQRTTTLRQVDAEEFDRTYMEQMVEDHLRAVNMFEEVAKADADPELRSWAAAQVPTLQAHLKRAQELRDSLGSATGS